MAVLFVYVLKEQTNAMMSTIQKNGMLHLERLLPVVSFAEWPKEDHLGQQTIERWKFESICGSDMRFFVRFSISTEKGPD